MPPALGTYWSIVIVKETMPSSTSYNLEVLHVLNMTGGLAFELQIRRIFAL